MSRSWARPLLVVVTALLLAATGLIGYVRAELVDTQAFSSRAASALDDPDVRTVVAERLTSAITNTVAPNAVIVRPLVIAGVAAVADTPQFRRALERALARRHERIFDGDASFVLDLIPGDGALLRSLRAILPPALDALPADIRLTITALDARNFELETARRLDDLASLWWPMLAAALLACAACALVAGGVRAALADLGIAVAGAGLVLVAAVAGLGAFVVSHAQAADLDSAAERGAVSALWNALFGDLRTAGLLAAVGGVAIAVVASGQVTTARLDAGARRAIELPGRLDPRLRAVVLIAAGVLLVVSPGLVVRAVAGVAGAALLLYGVALLAGRPGGAATGREESRPLAAGPGGESQPLPTEAGKAAASRGETRPFATVGVVAALVAATAAAIALVLPSPKATTVATVAPAGACNGLRSLCDKRLDEVVFPGTHNSYAASDEPGWYFANQRHGIARQLRDGIRTLLIDVHYGVRDRKSGRVRTDLAYEGSSRNKVARELSPQALRTADRLAGEVGLGVEGRRGVYLCHTLCELGAEPIDEQLGIVRRFLESHPRDVLILFVEPYVPAAVMAEEMEKAGLIRYAAELKPDAPLPTLRHLIRDDRRLIVLAEQDGGELPWYLDGFAFTQDTPLGATTPAQLRCGRFRGRADAPLFLVNHWIPPFPPSVTRNRAIGGRFLARRLRRCGRERGLVPNMVAVDFYENSGVVDVARRMNER